MPRIVIKATVNDAANWEQNFSSNLNKTQSESINNPIQVKVTGEHEVVAIFDGDNTETTLKALNSEATRKAMGIESMKLQVGDELTVDNNFNI